MDYSEVLEKIIAKQEETIGMIARQRAKRVDSITEEDGELKFEEPTEEDVEALMQEYKEIQGQGAVGIARKGMSEILDEDTEIELPEEIIPKDIKKDKFASGL